LSYTSIDDDDLTDKISKDTKALYCHQWFQFRLCTDIEKQIWLRILSTDNNLSIKAECLINNFSFTLLKANQLFLSFIWLILFNLIIDWYFVTSAQSNHHLDSIFNYLNLFNYTVNFNSVYNFVDTLFSIERIVINVNLFRRLCSSKARLVS